MNQVLAHVELLPFVSNEGTNRALIYHRKRLICKSFVSRSAKRIETNRTRLAARKHHEQTNRNSGRRKELEVLKLVVLGKENREIGQLLRISTRTVEAHRSRVMLKLNLTSLAGLVRYAVRANLIEA